MQERLDDLEAKFSFQEDMLQQLNDILIKQRQLSDELQRKIVWLEEQVSTLLADKDSTRPGADDSERPPHY